MQILTVDELVRGRRSTLKSILTPFFSEGFSEREDTHFGGDIC